MCCNSSLGDVMFIVFIDGSPVISSGICGVSFSICFAIATMLPESSSIVNLIPSFFVDLNA